MNRIIIYSETMSPELFADVFPLHRAVSVFSRSDCAEAILAESDIDALFLERSRLDEITRGFLLALCRHFPRLRIVLIAPLPTEPLPAQILRIDSSAGQASVLRQASSSVDAFAQREHRERLRFDWPLRGFVTTDGKEEIEVRIRSLGSTGAFLETSAVALPPGTSCRVRIDFLGSRLRAGALVVRSEQTGKPRGMGLRFQTLGEQARGFLDRIVHDAFVHALLEPDADIKSPALGGEVLLIPEFERS